MLERDLLVRYGQQLGSWVRLWDEEAAQAAETETPGPTAGRRRVAHRAWRPALS